MLKLINTVFLLLLLSVLTENISAQSPYELNPKKEANFFITGSLTIGLGYYYRTKIPLFSPADLELLDPQKVNNFDRNTINNYSKNAKKASDIFWGGSQLLPLLFLTNQKSRRNFGTIAALYGEISLLNLGVTFLTKNTVRRVRPYVYNKAVAIDEKLTHNAKTSFFSGHTSFAATNTFFVAKVFTDYYPDSRWKPLVWSVAALYPAATGYFRVAAGKHHPTDVITGYLIGAAIGVLVPHWHRNKQPDNRLSFHGGLNGALVQFKF